MKTILAAMVALSVSAAPVLAAQLYRWVDDKGNVEYRDTPPPASAKKVERRDLPANTIETSALPYSVQQAVKNHPVTLWVYDCGDPCAKARAHLAKRGVPFTERNPQKEPDAMKKATGGNDVPVLFVGSNQLKGYLDAAWDAALDSAGYPKSPPPGYKPPSQASAQSAGDAKGKAPPQPAAKGAAPPAAK